MITKPCYHTTVAICFCSGRSISIIGKFNETLSEKSVVGNMKNKIFNYRLSRARQTVECTFGILASRFRVFRKPFEIKVESVDNVVKAACVLHNYLRKEMSISNNITDEIGEMPDTQLLPLANNNCRTGSNAFLVRQKYTDYFNTVGSVPWQMDSVARGKY